MTHRLVDILALPDPITLSFNRYRFYRVTMVVYLGEGIYDLYIACSSRYGDLPPSSEGDAEYRRLIRRQVSDPIFDEIRLGEYEVAIEDGMGRHLTTRLKVHDASYTLLKVSDASTEIPAEPPDFGASSVTG